MDPNLPEANAAMGLLSAGLCRWSEGRAFFRASLAHESGVTSTAIDYALAVLLTVGDTAEALDVLDDALEADPESVRVRQVLAHLLVEHGDYDRALVLSRALVAEAPGVAGMQQTLGRALSLSGRAPKPGEGVTETENEWGYRGYMLASAGRGAEAQRLAEAHPDEPARQTLIYAGLKDIDRTIDALQRTARLDPWRALTWMRRPEIEPVIRGDPRVKVLESQLEHSGTCGAPGRGAEAGAGRSEQRGARSF
jgi:tetratricopeptide (TPR) repeat protein